MIVGKLTVLLGLDSKGFTTGINSATGKTTAFAAATDKTFKAISKAAKIGMLAVGAAFIKGAVDAAKFEKALANVSTMLDKNTMPMMKSFEKGILAMSEAYGESTDTLAKGLYDILSASIPASKALDVLDVSAKAAKAGLTDTGVAADAITTLMNSFGDATKDAGYYSDILFATVKFGKTTFAELAPVIGNVAKLMQVAGGTAEEMGAMLSIMTRNGIKTRVAVTSLRGVVNALIKPSEALTKELDGMTVKTDGFRAVMEKVGSLSAVDLAEMFPNVRALTGVVVAAKGLGEEVDKINALMAEGSPTMTAYDKNMATFAATWDRFKATLKATSITLGNELLPTLKEMFENMIEWFKENRENFAKFARDTLEGIRKLVTTIFNLKEILLGAGTAILGLMILSKVTELMTAFGIATSVSMGPVGLIAVAIGLLVAAFFKLRSTLRGQREQQELLDAAQKNTLASTEDYNEAIRIQQSRIDAEVKSEKERQVVIRQNIAMGRSSEEDAKNAAAASYTRMQNLQGQMTIIKRNAKDLSDVRATEKKDAEDKATQERTDTLATIANEAEEQRTKDESAQADRQRDAEEEQRIEDGKTAWANAMQDKIDWAKDVADAIVSENLKIDEILWQASASESDRIERYRAELELLGRSYEDIAELIALKFPEAFGTAKEAAIAFYDSEDEASTGWVNNITFKIKKVEDTWKDLKNFMKDNWDSVMGQMVGAFDATMQAIISLSGFAADEEIAAVEKKYAVLTQAEIAYQAFLDSEKIKDKKDQVDKLAQLKKDLLAETDALKRAELEKQIAELDTNILEQQLADDAAAARIKADETAAAEILKIKQEAWKKDKQLKLFMVAIDTAAAIVHSLYDPGGWAGAAMAIAAGITGIAQAAVISGTAMPMIMGGLVDKMIGGGAVRGNPGIDTNNVALTNREYVMPPQQSMDNFDELEDMRAGGSGGKNITIMPAHVELIMDDRSVGTAVIEFMTEESDRGGFRINPKVLGVLT